MIEISKGISLTGIAKPIKDLICGCIGLANSIVVEAFLALGTAIGLWLVAVLIKGMWWH